MSDMTVANTIFAQLGGYPFAVMTGAKDFMGSDYSLTFKIGRNCKSITHVRITLNRLDLYDVEFIKVRKMQAIPIKTENNIYFDQLQDVFTENTGLLTRL